MNEAEQRIVESLAHAKDAATVLDNIELKPNSPAEAGVHAEIKVAEASLATAIEKLETLKANSVEPTITPDAKSASAAGPVNVS